MKYYTVQRLTRIGEVVLEIWEFDSAEARGIHLWRINTRLAREGYPTPKAMKVEPDMWLVRATVGTAIFPARVAYRDGQWTLLTKPASAAK